MAKRERASRLGRSVKALLATTQPTRQLCPSCGKLKVWPDGWRNDVLRVPPGGLRYICQDCFVGDILPIRELDLQTADWLTKYRERLNLPGELALERPQGVLESLIEVLGKLYEEAKALRTHYLVAEAHEKEKT